MRTAFEQGDEALDLAEIAEGLREPADLLADVQHLLLGGRLNGLRALVTAGPTREPLDPVRFLSNRSTGRMGFALAAAARVTPAARAISGSASSHAEASDRSFGRYL